ncbi:MAG TPA: EF-P lysine aminoacylase EpmA [Pirellulaceae bacterium]|nr:EF-P lysine aminoacylase EpmA [Pirellulaceae bacterium]
MSDRDRLASLKPNLALRSRILSTLRGELGRLGLMEVETPVRLGVPALEAHIDAEPSGAGYLRTSPELHMKRLLAAGYDGIFQLGPCFRQGEKGGRHHPEFTMLEWYRLHADYRVILDDTRKLLGAVGELLPEGSPVRALLEAEWQILSVSEAFRGAAGWDPAEAWDADRFDLDLVERVEPSLPVDVPVVLIDYPAPAAALSRRKPEAPGLAERWELYLGGVEIANAYSELTDPVEQRARFAQAASERAARGKVVYPLDEPFLEALEAGLPPCAGIALGVDRLVMICCGATGLDEVLAFREDLPG